MREETRTDKTKVTKAMKIKSNIVVVFFMFAIMVITFNMFNIQIVKHEEYKAKASSVQLRDTKIAPKRGTIYDSNMKVLAQSATVWTVFLSPADSKEEQHQRISQKLGEILEIDPDKIFEKLQKSKSYYEVLKYKIDKPIADQIKIFCEEENIVGVNLVEDYKRYYPYGSFAATILGFCGTDNQGLSGLESYYDEELTGIQGRVISAKNGWGLDMGYEYEELNKARDGYSLVTTIDETIQHYLEKHLSMAARSYNVRERAVGIVMNVKTGAILAMSTKPDYDPNEPYILQDPAAIARVEAVADPEEKVAAMSNERQRQWRNKAVSDLYEPGSVFKVITASAALDSGAATLNSSFRCAGHVVVDGWTIGCNNRAGHGTLSFSQALIESCNPSFIAMGQKMGKNTFYDYFYSFGLAEKTGIDLPGEQLSQYYKPDNMSDASLASASFGQSNKITPIQMITAISTAVNGGQLVVPHVVSQILDSDGNVVENLTPQPKRQVISEEVSSKVRQIMKENVDSGHAGYAYVAGYRAGGKSGTSQKLDNRTDENGNEVYIASFVGVAPCDDPEIAILIFFDEPNTTSYYGGVLAGPVVGALMGEILPYLGVEPVYTEAESSKVQTTVPKITGMAVTEAQVKVQRAGFTVKTVGNGATVVSQYPTESMRIAKGGVVIAYTDSAAEGITVSMPNLVGKTPKDVQNTLYGISLNFKEEGASSAGSGATVTSQSVPPGEKVPLGTVITVTYGTAGIVE